MDKGFSKGDINRVLAEREPGKTRGSCFKLDKVWFNKDIGKAWFANRVVDEWKRIGSHVVGNKNIDASKMRLDKFMDSEARWV